MNSNNKRIVKNSIFLLSRTIFLTFVTLYTLSEVISILGAEEFGLYSVVFGIVALFAFVNGALLSGAQRFLSFDIGLGDLQKIKNTFISSIYIHIIISFLICALIYLLKDIFLEDVLNVKNYNKEAEIIYNFAIFSIFISILQIPFSALITAYEKMQAFAYLAIIDGLLRLTVVYFLAFFTTNKVVVYSLFLTIVSLLIFVFHYIYCLLNFKKVIGFERIKINKLKKLMSDMVKFMGWNLIGNLSVVMKNQGTNVLLNVFFGLLVNAAFSITLTVMAAISTLISSVSNAINPQIFKNYANKNFNNYFDLIDYGTKFCMILVSIVILPLAYCMEFILKVWLKEVPIYAVEFTQMGLFLVLVESFSILIISAIQATGNIKGTQITVGSLLLLNIPITYILFTFNHHPNVIFYTSILISFIAFFVRIFFLIRLTGYKFKFFSHKVFLPVFIMQLFMFFGIFVYDYIFGIPRVLQEFINFILLFVFYSIFLAYYIGLNKLERNKIKSFVFKKLKN